MTKKQREGGPALRVRTAVFILKGRLDAGQAEEVAAAVASTDVSVRRVVLDLSAVTFIGPEVLEVLERQSGRVAVVIGDRYADVLHAIEAAGFAEPPPVFDTVAHALVAARWVSALIPLRSLVKTDGGTRNHFLSGAKAAV